MSREGIALSVGWASVIGTLLLGFIAGSLAPHETWKQYMSSDEQRIFASSNLTAHRLIKRIEDGKDTTGE